jgi:glycosyltransferase involved in cell wall biosynthesis
MTKKTFDITFKRNHSCKTAKEFIDNYFESSYYHQTYLTDTYEIHSYNNTRFNDTTAYKNILWNFLNLNSFFNLLKLSRIINREKHSIVFLHGFNSPIQALILRTFLDKQIKLVVQHHAEKPYLNSFKGFIQKLAYRNLSAYVFATKALATQYIQKKIINEGGRIEEIMEGSTLFQLKDKQACRKALNLNDEKIFLWVGRLDVNKDPLTALKAFKAYKEQGANFKLYLFYHSASLEKEVTDYVSRNILSEHVILRGKVPHEELETWYNAADFFISASHYEGSGYALCEAMACGCVPIASSIPSFRMMTDEGRIGKLFEAGNSNDLLAKLVEVEQINFNDARLSVRDQFANHLSFRAISEKFKILIRDLLAK